MANLTYPTFKALAETAAGLLSGVVKAALVSKTSGAVNYVYNPAHNFFDDVPAGSIVAAGVALSGRAISVPGAFSADPIVFPSVPAPGAGQIGEAVVLYIDTGVAATSPLVGYGDAATGLPVTPNGDDITVTFSGNIIIPA